MTDEELRALAGRCASEAEQIVNADAFGLTACILDALRAAHEAGQKQRHALPEGSPLSEETLGEARDWVARLGSQGRHSTVPVTLLRALDHALESLAGERDRADRAEREAAYLAQDREEETGLRASGVAAALAVVGRLHADFCKDRDVGRKYGDHDLEYRAAYAAAAKAILDRVRIECGPGEPLAYERLLAECRRKTAALQKIAHDEEKMIASKVLAIAREALEEQP